MVAGTLALLGIIACAEAPRGEPRPSASPARLASAAPPAQIAASSAPAAQAQAPMEAPSSAAPALPATKRDEAPLSPAEVFVRGERRRRGLPPEGDEPSLCARQRTTSAGLLIALCNTGGSAHADSGWVDFFQLETRAGALASKAQLLHVESGSGFGSAGELHAIELGKSTPAFAIDGAYGNHGELYSSQAIVALRRGAWAEVARVTALTDNDGSDDCAAHPRRCLRLTLSVSARGSAEPADLVVMLRGTRGGRRTTRRYTLRFDDRRGVYAVPRALQPSD